MEDVGIKLFGSRHIGSAYTYRRYVKNTPTSHKNNQPEEKGSNAQTNDARMYIGNVFIDELDAVQFVLQDNKIDP